MQRLSGLDDAFLSFETPSTPLHVASITILDGTDFDYDRFRAHIESRLHLLPPFTRKLVEVPFGLDHPYWVEDPDFDIEFHLRRIALPPPGDDHLLAEQVARIHGRPLDRSRPLWEIYLIEGVHGKDVGVLTRMHHAAIDGVSGAEILTTMLDTSPDYIPPDEPVPLRRERVPSQLEMFARGSLGLVTRPAQAIRVARRTVSALPMVGAQVGAAVARLRDRATEDPSRPRVQAPPTPFNATITAHRRFAFGSVSLDTVKAIKNATGTTVNDVVMAACAGALRHYLLSHDALPDLPLQAMVPISVRTEAEQGAMGNRVTSLVSVLPTDVDDPLERLARTHAAMLTAKEHNAVPADLLADYTEFVAPAVAARAARAVARLRLADRVRSPINLVISNIPGPNFPLYYAGARMKALYPVSAVADGTGLNITLQSYMGSLDFGLVACRELVPDLWDLMELLHAEFAALEKAAL